MITKTHNKQILLEAIDQKQMQDALKALSYMRKIDFSDIPSLQNAVKKTVDDVNAQLSKDEGGVLKRASDVVSKAFQVLKQRSTAPLQTPMGKALDMAVSIETGFDSMISIIDANVADINASAEKVLIDAVTGKADLVQNLIAKAFKNNAKTYNAENVANEIMQLKISKIAELVKKIKNDVGHRDVLTLLSKAIKAQATGNQPTEPTKSTTATTSTDASKSTVSSQQSGATTETQPALKKALPDMLKSSGVNKNDFIAVMKSISKSGYKLVKNTSAAK
jgi:hypothetical protein